MTQNIFLSYRRDDSRGYTNAIYTLLELHFPPDSIFMDVDTLVPGSDFVQSLEEAVENCDIFLAIIGSRWENIEDQKGLRRLENPEDFVRIEIAHALKRGIPVIPVLVDGAQMPFTENLPNNIKALARRHAFSIGDHMRSDVQRLIKVLEKTFESLEKERLEQEKKEAELLVRAQAEQERKIQEKAEADRKAKEQVEADRIAKEQAEADRKAKEKVEADRIAKEKAEADRIAREKAETDRIAKEQAEADRKAKEKAEIDQIAREKAEEDRKAKKEAKQKAKALAAAEKKADNEKKRLSGRKTKTTAAQQGEKTISQSALKRIPVWVWPVAGLFLITTGYVIFGGFSPSLPEDAGMTETVQGELSLSSTYIVAAVTETPLLSPTPTSTATSTPEPLPTPILEIGSTKISPVDGMVQVYIPAGEFLMGSSSGNHDEKPVHSVYLDAYWMDEHEVTVSQFQQFLGEEDYSANPCGSRDNHPAACVDWYDAQAYCEWRGDRLPTEAEWEKAARGDLEGKRYPWGDEDPVCETGAENGAQFRNCLMFKTAPVKTFASNGYGLYDMAGNVWEWAADWYGEDTYSISPIENPQGPTDGDYRVLRGGSWGSNEPYLRAAERGKYEPDNRDTGIGFRCASEASP